MSLFRLNLLVCWLQRSVKKPIRLHADGHTEWAGKFLAMENYTTGGNVHFFGTVALQIFFEKVNQKSTRAKCFRSV